MRRDSEAAILSPALLPSAPHEYRSCEDMGAHATDLDVTKAVLASISLPETVCQRLEREVRRARAAGDSHREQSVGMEDSLPWGRASGKKGKEHRLLTESVAVLHSARQSGLQSLPFRRQRTTSRRRASENRGPGGRPWAGSEGYDGG